MSARGFRSVFMVGAVATAALGCYLISLNVASERAELERVETKIVMAQRELRVLQTEIGTRGRLAQLERWNANAIRLSAPTADQFASDGFQLATLARPEDRKAIEAPLVYASVSKDDAPQRATATTDDATAPPPGRAPSDMMHVASYAKPAPVPAAARTTVTATPSAKPKPATKPAKTAMADPLSPLPSAKSKAKANASTATPAKPAPKAATKPTPKETGTP